MIRTGRCDPRPLKHQLHYSLTMLLTSLAIIFPNPSKSFCNCFLGTDLSNSVSYLSMNRFIEKITLSKLDGTYIKLLNHLERQALIIIDDFGLQPMQQEVKLALLQILEERHGKRSTLITSQLPVAKWYDYINEPTIADAIMDRLKASAHRIELKGESLRRKK